MNILFYGYGNHARRIKTYLDKYIKIPVNYCFINKSLEKINNVDCFNSIEDCLLKFKEFKCVFITSPNEYHLEHLKNCLNYSIPYIYVEKPAIGIEEYLKKSKNKINNLKFLQVGYHYNYTSAINKLKKIIDNNSAGSLLRLDMFFGKGLAFKDNFKNQWRSLDKEAIAHTLGCHLLNIALYLLGKDTLSSNNYVIKKSIENLFYDTYHFYGLSKNKVLISISASWGSPFEQVIKAYFSDMIWEYDMEQILETNPRDCFDQNGLFIKPKTKRQKFLHEGISASISSFIDKVLTNQIYKYEFNNSASTTELLLNN